jgi:hypothetical protein
MQAFEFARTSIYESSFKLFLFAELVCKICKKEALYESRFKLFLFAEQSPSKKFSYPGSGSSKMSNSH